MIFSVKKVSPVVQSSPVILIANSNPWQLHKISWIQVNTLYHKWLHIPMLMLAV